MLKDVIGSIYNNLGKLIPTEGSLYNRVADMYLSSSLIYGETSHLFILNRIYKMAYPDELQDFIHRDLLANTMIGLWQLRILADVGKRQFDVYVSRHPDLVESGDVFKLGLRLHDDISKIDKPKLTSPQHIKRALQALLPNDQFIISKEPIARPRYTVGRLLTLNVVHSELIYINSKMINQLVATIQDEPELHAILTDEFMKDIKWFSGQLASVSKVEGNILPMAYELFYEILDTFIYRHDKSYIKTKVRNPRLKLI